LQINGILLGVLLVLASVACAVGIWALLEGAKTARSTRTLAEDLDARVVPLLDKADITIDALNAELLRVDNIVSRIEEVTERVESTSRTVQGVANAPGEIVTDIADRVRRAWKRRQAESSAASDVRRAEAAQAAEASEATDLEQEPEPVEAPVWPAVEEYVRPAAETGPTAAETTSD
jgi:TolA-binding protein